MRCSTPHDFCATPCNSCGLSLPAPGISRSIRYLGMASSCDGMMPRPASVVSAAGLLGPLAQEEFLNLAGGGLGQRTEHDVARDLVVCDLLAQKADDVLGGRLGAGLERDVRARR